MSKFGVPPSKMLICMLWRDKIIALFCFVDDLLVAIGHKEHPDMIVSDSEIITTAFVAAANYGGHLEYARRQTYA
jgi:hypothetical protein